MSLKIRDLFSRSHNISNSEQAENTVGNLGLFLVSVKRRGFDPVNILDVGANRGDWSVLAKKVFPRANLFMIEPLAEMEEHLKSFCSKYEGSKYFLCGAGSTTSKRYLTTWGDELAGASCMLEENPNLRANNMQREIQLVTIDSLIEEGKIPMPDMVKIDIQGFEIEALKGAQRIFGSSELIIVESSLFEFTKGIPLVSEVIEFMRIKGYEVYDFSGFLHRPFDGAMAQVDICFAKKDGILRASDAWKQDKE